LPRATAQPGELVTSGRASPTRRVHIIPTVKPAVPYYSTTPI
jgi:hypothetical protein